jgi:muramidase (phage lysozyme)
MVGDEVAMTPNKTAFLSMTGACEGADYNTLYGGGTFSDFSKHPRQKITAGGYTSTAAGRYQILASTWDDFCKDRGARPFDPDGQDECALWLIDRRGATADVEAGRLEHAVAKCGKEWASFPGSPYGQRTRSMDFCRQHYLAAGGSLADEIETQPAAPIEDRSTPIPPDDPTFTIGGADNSNSITQGGRVPFIPIMLSLLPSVLNLFAPRAQAALQKVTQQPPDVVQGFVQSLFDKLGQLTGQTDPIQATAAITKDPAADKVADLQEHALDYLDKLGPVLDKLAGFDAQAWQAEESSRDGAAARALRQQEAGSPWTNPTFIIAIAVMVLVSVVVGAVLFKGGFSTDMQAYVIGAIVGSSLTGVLGFYFGSSRSSSAKDVLIGEMARQGSK